MSEPQQQDRLLVSKTLRPSSQLRRLSSKTAQREDLFSHPAVVAPPVHMENPSNAHETALAMEMAKHRLFDESGSSTPTNSTNSTAATTPDPDQIPTTDKYAFAFDIDGVLIRGGEVMPESIEAMKVLNGQNEHNVKVYVLAECCAQACNTSSLHAQSIYLCHQWRW
jgi:hypothetical protein